MKIVDIARITSRPFEFILQFILGKKKNILGDIIHYTNLE
jgi:hypothetical protein